MTKIFDVIIIGGGPIGIATAIACKKKKLNYLILEKGALTNSLFNYPLNMKFFSTSEKLEIDNVPFISINDKPNRDEALEYYRRIVRSYNLNINLYERVKSVYKVETCFKVETEKTAYNALNIVVSTGFYDIPAQLNVKGEELPKVQHYFTEAHPYVLQKVAIVGASNSAVDAALEIWRNGGEVTMIVRGKEIGERVKYWVRPNIINRIKEGSIKAIFNAEIKEIQHDKLIITTPDGIIELENDVVLALTGYRPNFDFLRSMGIELSSEDNIPNYNPETMESNIKGIYLAGVICGGNETHKWFIENSRVHATIIANSISDNQ